MVHHIAIACRNLAQMEAFYRKHFGFTRSRVFNPGTLKEFLMLRSGNSRIELFSAEKNAAPASGKIGVIHLAFEVDNIETITASLASDGVMADTIIDYSTLSPGFRICFFNDPEGNRIEVIEGYRDEY